MLLACVPLRENSEKPQERDVTVPPTLCDELQRCSTETEIKTLDQTRILRIATARKKTERKDLSLLLLLFRQSLVQMDINSKKSTSITSNGK